MTSKRDAIIQATIALVEEKGISGASTAMIAKRAEVAEVTLFRQFRTKEDLLLMIFEELLQKVQKATREGLDAGWPLKDQFLHMARRGLEYFTEHPENLNYIQQFLNSPNGWSQRPDMRYQKSQFGKFPLIDLLEEGVATKQIRKLPISTLYGMVTGALTSFVIEQHVKQVRYSKKVREEIITSIWGAIAIE